MCTCFGTGEIVSAQLTSFVAQTQVPGWTRAAVVAIPICKKLRRVKSSVHNRRLVLPVVLNRRRSCATSTKETWQVVGIPRIDVTLVCFRSPFRSHA